MRKPRVVPVSKGDSCKLAHTCLPLLYIRWCSCCVGSIRPVRFAGAGGLRYQRVSGRGAFREEIEEPSMKRNTDKFESGRAQRTLRYSRKKKCPICYATCDVDSRDHWAEYHHVRRSAPLDIWRECGLHCHILSNHWAFCVWMSTMPECPVCQKRMSAVIRESVESDCHLLHTHIMRLSIEKQVQHIKFLMPLFLLTEEEKV